MRCLFLSDPVSTRHTVRSNQAGIPTRRAVHNAPLSESRASAWNLARHGEPTRGESRRAKANPARELPPPRPDHPRPRADPRTHRRHLRRWPLPALTGRSESEAGHRDRDRDPRPRDRDRPRRDLAYPEREEPKLRRQALDRRCHPARRRYRLRTTPRSRGRSATGRAGRAAAPDDPALPRSCESAGPGESSGQREKGRGQASERGRARESKTAPGAPARGFQPPRSTLPTHASSDSAASQKAARGPAC